LGGRRGVGEAYVTFEGVEGGEDGGVRDGFGTPGYEDLSHGRWGSEDEGKEGAECKEGDDIEPHDSLMERMDLPRT